MLGFLMFLQAISPLSSLNGPSAGEGIIYDNLNGDIPYNINETPIGAWYNNSEDPIYINELGPNNWTWARTQQWCQKGDGSWTDPYVIENVTIDAGGVGNCIDINNSKNVYFIIRNCTLTNAQLSSSYAGIKFERTCNGTLNNINLTSTYRAIWLRYSSNNNSIDRCNILSSTNDGIFLQFDCDNNTIWDNYLYGCGEDGIALSTNCTYNNITENELSNILDESILLTGSASSPNEFNIISGNNISNPTGADPIGVSLTYSNNCIIEDNWIYNAYNGIQLLTDCDNNIIQRNNISDCSRYGIYIDDNCDNNSITYNNASFNGDSGSYCGIRLTADCHSNNIVNNTCNNNTWNGIGVYGGDFNTISYNNVSGNNQGITLSSSGGGSHYNVIIGNNASYNNNYGIAVYYDSDHNNITDNICNFNTDGIRLNEDCDNNTITGNTLFNNADNGVYLHDNCDYNNITSNNIDKNLDEGIFIEDFCDYNTISYNNITNNLDRGIELSGTNSQNNLCGYNNISYNYINNNLIGYQSGWNCSYNVISHNTINGSFYNGIGFFRYDYYNNVSYNKISNCSSNGIRINSYCDFYEVWNNTIVNCGEGIYVNEHSDSANIVNNTVSFCDYGIWINEYGDYCNITDNEVYNCTSHGIYLNNLCTNNSIYSNNVYNNSVSGIALELNSHNNIINNNTVNNNNYGINIITSDDILIANNTCNYNYYYGIRLHTSNWNTITNNEACFSDTDSGVYIQENSFYNVVKNNNLSNNFLSGYYSWYNNDENNITGNTMIGNQGNVIRITSSESDYNIFAGNILRNNVLGISDSGTNYYHMNEIDGIYTALSIDNTGGFANCITWEEAVEYIEWIDGDGTWGNPYVIEDLVIDADLTSSANGLYVRESYVYFIIRNCTIYDVSSSNFMGGIKCLFASNGQLIGNNCTDGYSGIQIYEAVNNFTIINNTCSFTGQGIHIRENSFDILVLNNTCNNNTGSGINVHDNCSNLEITNNTVNYNDLHGIYLSDDCDNNIITGNDVIGNTENGLYLLEYCDWNNISYNNCSGNGNTGIIISGDDSQYYLCSYNTISSNYLYDNLNGIQLQNNCDFNNISYNTLIKHVDTINLYATGSDNNNNNAISYNTIRNSTGIGIRLNFDSVNNIITGNDIANCSTGISILQGSCTGNVIYNNTFSQNTLHAIDDGVNNQWYNGSLGNYWDNYTGEDTNDDGIGDSAYIFISGTAGSQDNFPIWWDAPVVVIDIPSHNYQTGIPPPNYEISLSNGNESNCIYWYRLWNASNGYTINETGISLAGIINQALWDVIGNGSMRIQFWANDSRGYSSYTNRTVWKNIYVPTININATYLYDGIVIGFTAPDFVDTLSRNIANTPLNYSWYMIYNGSWSSKNFFFDNNTINQTLWDYLGNDTVWIYFYVNDSLGNIGNNSVMVHKDIIKPEIYISNPASYDIYGYVSPTIILSIIEPHFNTSWYTLNGYNNSISQTGGKLNQTGWTNAIANGTLTIRFYCLDSGGNFNYTDFILRIDIIAPIVSVTAPITGGTWKDLPPIYSLTITEPNLEEIYFTMDAGVTNYSLGIVISGTISQTIWDSIPNGYITIKFYVRDVGGNVGTHVDAIIIVKEATVTPPPEDPGMPFWVQAIIAGAISGCVGLMIRIGYGKIKKDKKETEVIVQQFNKISNSKQFFQKQLSERQWVDFEDLYEKYEHRNISKQELISGGKKAIGEDFIKIFDVSPEEMKAYSSPKKLKIKAAKSGKAAVPPPVVPLTAKDKKEIAATEAEMGVEKQAFNCVVHKGPIEGDNYLCPKCQTFYCVKCAMTLKEKGEKCWSCDTEIKLDTMKRIAPEIQQKIEELQKKVDSLKLTVKNLDDSYYHGAIQEDEYIKMKKSLADNIKVSMAEIKKLQSSDAEPVSKPEVKPDFQDNIQKVSLLIESLNQVVADLDEQLKAEKITQEEYLAKKNEVGQKLGETMGVMDKAKEMWEEFQAQKITQKELDDYALELKKKLDSL